MQATFFREDYTETALFVWSMISSDAQYMNY